MWIPSSTRSPSHPSPRSRAAVPLALLLMASSACSDPKPAHAQQIVFDPKNYLESALHTAHELESLSRQASMLANQARSLAASPYSHLAQTNQTLRDISDLARTVRGVAADASRLETQFKDLYPTAVKGADPRSLLQQAASRADTARDTAQDLARTAADLERLSRGRDARVAGALSASQAAQGPTSAMQASAQLLAAMSEDMGSLRSVALAQARLMSEEAAARAADQAAGAERHRRLWAHEAGTIPPPDFDPLPYAKK